MIKTHNTLTIDPGSSGGFAWQIDGLFDCCPMPETDGDVLNKLRELRIQIHCAIVEHQIGVVGPKFKVSATSMFTFGDGYGFIRGALMALNYRVELVRPMKWQKSLSLGTKKEAGGTTPWKNKLKNIAQQRFPGANVTLKTADALLLLDYARLL